MKVTLYISLALVVLSLSSMAKAQPAKVVYIPIEDEQPVEPEEDVPSETDSKDTEKKEPKAQSETKAEAETEPAVEPAPVHELEPVAEPVEPKRVDKVADSEPKPEVLFTPVAGEEVVDRPSAWSPGEPLPGTTASCDPYDNVAFYLGDSPKLKIQYNEYIRENGSPDGFALALQRKFRRKRAGGTVLMIPAVALMLGSFALGFMYGLTEELEFLAIGVGVELVGVAFLIPGIINLVKGKRGVKRIEQALDRQCSNGE